MGADFLAAKRVTQLAFSHNPPLPPTPKPMDSPWQFLTLLVSVPDSGGLISSGWLCHLQQAKGWGYIPEMEPVTISDNDSVDPVVIDLDELPTVDLDLPAGEASSSAMLSHTQPALHAALGFVFSLPLSPLKMLWSGM